MSGMSCATSQQRAPHTYACPLRWGDLDMLGHTNNVRYFDYVQEARLELLTAAGLPVAAEADHLVVVRHDVSFEAPLMFREEPVTVESTVTEVGAARFVTEHTVLDRPGEAGAESPLVYFRARSELCIADAGSGAPRRLTAPEADGLRNFAGPQQEPPLRTGPLSGGAPASAAAYAVRTRWTDADAYGHVGNVSCVEYLQEARLRMLGLERWAGHGGDLQQAGGFENMLVVARTALAYETPLRFRLQPYEVRSWVSRIGGASFDVDSVVVDPLAPRPAEAPLLRGRVTLVGFDPEAQRSAALTDGSRAVLQRLQG